MPLAEVAQTYDADHTYRYASASGDHPLIHIEPKAAREAGLPGIIVHRLCTMAFTSRAIIETFLSEGSDAAQATGGALRRHRTAEPDDEYPYLANRPKRQRAHGLCV